VHSLSASAGPRRAQVQPLGFPLARGGACVARWPIRVGRSAARARVRRWLEAHRARLLA